MVQRFFLGEETKVGERIFFTHIRELWDDLKSFRKEKYDLKKLVHGYFGETPPVDRVGDWDRFAAEMHDYIAKFTVGKYQGNNDFDLMTITEPRESLWNIIKYSLRMWNGKGKRYDWYKIAHYTQMGWTKANASGNTDWKSLGIEQDITKTG
jgi:hypothetical protein